MTGEMSDQREGDASGCHKIGSISQYPREAAPFPIFPFVDPNGFSSFSRFLVVCLLSIYLPVHALPGEPKPLSLHDLSGQRVPAA